MDTFKLKMKIGIHEFEAEGPTEVVQAQFAAFKDLIAGATVAAVSSKPAEEPIESEQPQNQVANTSQFSLDRIVRVEGRIISLTARTNSVADAVMLILLAQRTIRNYEVVTSSAVVDGLKTSGHIVNRIDAVMQKLASEGYVIKIGQRRATNYRLTNQGTARAQEIAKSAIASVA
jgi:hypothetical protein